MRSMCLGPYRRVQESSLSQRQCCNSTFNKLGNMAQFSCTEQEEFQPERQRRNVLHLRESCLLRGEISRELWALLCFFQVTDQLRSGEEAFQEDVSISQRPMSNLEKVHFIIGNAILRPAIRQEICVSFLGPGGHYIKEIQHPFSTVLESDSLTTFSGIFMLQFRPAASMYGFLNTPQLWKGAELRTVTQ